MRRIEASIRAKTTEGHLDTHAEYLGLLSRLKNVTGVHPDMTLSYFPSDQDSPAYFLVILDIYDDSNYTEVLEDLDDALGDYTAIVQ